jgi:vanillate O-demethylase ferredoxin subunit
MRVKLVRKLPLAADICGFELADPEGRALPPFSAGAHVDVLLGPGLVRQYSLCNNPEDRHRYLIGVLLDPHSRGGSAAMHALAEGTELEIGEPKNHFPLAAEAGHSLLIAGGIGVTPILCMAERLAHLGASFEMHYCTRSPERTAFLDRLSRPDLAERVRVYHDSEPADRRIDLAGLLASPKPETHLYVCGPGGFIDLVLGLARAAGWAEERLHREYFAAPAAASAGGDRPFQVKLSSSGQVVDVAAGQSVIEALAGAGIDILTSCEQGVCGTCLTRVLEGVPEHRDVYLTDAEKAANDQFLPCCSRSRSPLLVLDL